jgi:hypothetical protein
MNTDVLLLQGYAAKRKPAGYLNQKGWDRQTIRLRRLGLVARPRCAERKETAGGAMHPGAGTQRNAATLGGAKIIDSPPITTQRGQTTCHELMSRFICDIQ